MPDHFIFIPVLIGLIGMLMGVMGIITEIIIIFDIGFILVVSAIIGLLYMWVLK